MANIDRPNGFHPEGTVSGASWTAKVRRYAVAARSDATNNHGDIYLGDPVNLSTSGVITVANSGSDVLGVVVGVGDASSITHGDNGPFNASDLTQRYIAHDEAGYVWVVDAKDTIFSIQTDSDLDLSPGELADFNVVAATAHGSRTTGFSSAELTTASDNDVIVVEDDTSPNNDTTSANAVHYVMFINPVNAQS
jgi:hypothetical protein